MSLLDTPEVVRSAFAAVGAAVAMLWMKETLWLRRIVLFIGGVVFAVAATPDVAQRVHLSALFVSLMLGMGSMMTMANILKTVQDFNLGKFMRDLAYKWAGLPPPPATSPAPLTKD